MSSVLLLALLGCLIAIPGIPASLIAFPSGESSFLTRVAAAFGLGYAASAGLAFALAAAHAFRLTVYVPIWVGLCAVLWFFAIRRSSVSDQLKVMAADVRSNRLALAIGAIALFVLFAIHLKYMYVLGAPRYVYYLNGIEIANSHGVPAATLEYGQSWPPATDKIYLDAFTGLLVLFTSNAALGPGVLLVVSIIGAFLGLWATAWELGLRRTSVLLPVLCLANTAVLSTTLSIGFTDYRAEDFGRAVAFCALAVGIAAIRDKGWRLAIAAGLILAAASGSHLIPVVVVVLVLCLAGFAAVVFGTGRDVRRQAFLRLVSVGGVSLVFAAVIRLFAGGAFGLEGASNQSGYAKAGTPYDPGAYLYGGKHIAMHPASWGTQPGKVINAMVAGAVHAPELKVLLLIVLPVIAAAVLLARPEYRALAVVGLGMMGALVVVGVGFAIVYHTYVDETFGVRRLTGYLAIGFALLLLGVAEVLLALIERAAPKIAVWTAAAAVLGVCAWLLPSTNVSADTKFVGSQRVKLVDWVRTSTPCDSRFLINQRTEGTFTALTGRFALTEGMGAFLRTNQLPYVVKLMLQTQSFFHYPVTDEQFLREHNISYVVVALGYQELGYEAPIGPPNTRQLSATPFLQLVYSSRSIMVYKVVGDPASPVSPLLKGPYLHCITRPITH